MNETSPENQIHTEFVHSTPDKITQRDAIVHTIYQNQEIADVSALRAEVLKSIAGMNKANIPFPAALQIQKRTERLRPFASFFQRILDPDSLNPRMRSLVRNMKIAAQFGWQAQAFRHVPSLFDPHFSDPNDFIEPIFSTIFQDQHVGGLLYQWMQALDDRVAASSRSLLHEIDQAAQEQRTPLRKEVVLVGGGPLTSIVASILGAFFHITIITEQRGIGKPWRNRPISINSSSRINDFNGAPLPLLGGGTTRIVGRQQFNSLNMDLLLGTDTKSVLCDTGENIEYVAGPRMGDLIATNILFHADDYLINQQVDVSKIQRTTDGDIRLLLISTEDGTRRELDASTVFILTGPGKERSTIPSASSSLYQDTTRQLDAQLHHIRSRLTWHREALRKLEALPSRAGVQSQCHWLHERIAQTPIEIPHVLTLTAMEKLYEYWEEDLGADPACFPLIDLLTRQNTIAYVGNGDTMRTLKELVEGRGPVSAYPAGCEPKERKSSIYNESASSPQDYDASNRRRYQGTYTANTTAIPFKVKRYRLSNTLCRVEVTHQDETGKRRRRLYDYVFDCTGLERRPIETMLPASFSCQDIRDLQGGVVARGISNLFIVGAATSFNVSDFPEKIQTIIRTLGIPENTISLWVNGILAERLAYTYLVTRNKQKNERNR